MIEKNSMKLALLPVEYKNDFDIIEKLLKCYSIMKDIPLRPFELKVLKYYIKYGYVNNKELKSMIMEDEKRTEQDIKTVNSYLRKAGFLELGVSNMRKSKLSSDMELIRKKFILEKTDMYILKFNNV